MHKVKQFKVNAKTLSGLCPVLTIARFTGLETISNFQELGAGPRIALGTEDYESAMILFHYPAINSTEKRT